MEIVSRNTNTLQPVVTQLLTRCGVRETSRNGPVLRIAEPVLTEITHPWERVNFCPDRNANPFFHLVEAAAMLGNVNSVRLMSYFASNMSLYSDDGAIYNAFYGTRLRAKWGDQLSVIIRNLWENPDSRQEVALIWSPEDLTKKTKDKACNLALIFSINQTTNAVEMTSLNRSNDAIFGFVSGANMVHLSYFHEYVACGLDRSMGSWFHFTNNLHVYLDNPKWEQLQESNYAPPSYPASASDRTFRPFDFASDRLMFDDQLSLFLAGAIGLRPLMPLAGDFPWIADLRTVYNTWLAHKTKSQHYSELVESTEDIKAADWRIACRDWIIRHYSE